MTSAVLIVPGGIVGMSGFNLFRHVLVWQMLYAMTGIEKCFQKIMDAFFTDCPDERVEEFFRLTLTGMRMDTRQMKLLTKNECGSFDRPVHIIASEHDVVFNCKALKARVTELYPHATFDILEGSKHSPSIEPEKIESLNAKVIGFLEQARFESSKSDSKSKHIATNDRKTHDS